MKWNRVKEPHIYWFSHVYIYTHTPVQRTNTRNTCICNKCCQTKLAYYEVHIRLDPGKRFAITIDALRSFCV